MVTKRLFGHLSAYFEPRRQFAGVPHLHSGWHLCTSRLPWRGRGQPRAILRVADGVEADFISGGLTMHQFVQHFLMAASAGASPERKRLLLGVHSETE